MVESFEEYLEAYRRDSFENLILLKEHLYNSYPDLCFKVSSFNPFLLLIHVLGIKMRDFCTLMNAQIQYQYLPNNKCANFSVQKTMANSLPLIITQHGFSWPLPPAQCYCTFSEHNRQAGARTPAYIALFLILSEEIIF